jgi:hypothetical protein
LRVGSGAAGRGAGNEGGEQSMPTGRLMTHDSFSPNGTQLLMIYESGVAELWDLRLIRQDLAELGLDWEMPPLP